MEYRLTFLNQRNDLGLVGPRRQGRGDQGVPTGIAKKPILAAHRQFGAFAMRMNLHAGEQIVEPGSPGSPQEILLVRPLFARGDELHLNTLKQFLCNQKNG
jgi:hypothetical protein